MRVAAVGGSRLLSVGAYRPARVVSNAEICAQIDSTDEWIKRRSGIASRRFADDTETVVSMAAAAGRQAVERAGLEPGDVDAVLLASMSRVQQTPPAAPQVAQQVGAATAAALDLGAACAGFCHAIAVADGLIWAGSARHVLVVGSERMTDIIDPTDRSLAFLFADGAGAVLVGPAPEPSVGPVVWGSDGSRAGLIGHQEPWTSMREKPDFWPTMTMAGPEVFRWAVQEVTATARAALTVAGLDPASLAAFVPHQANARITDRMAADLGLPPSCVVAADIETAGNTSAASIPLALDALLAAPDAPHGAALLVGFGAGLSYSAMVVDLP
ncbi:3-oxoacyl-[acyl-carrier-protein] synthase-3 [Asanoa ferruginea]|uniref:3-oxoacyl-[acyl-carrier-protein] synthase-3 n=1 Tax=Asanoa ferruginea TaxID=53367 RepID=A0A3D9ZJ06_9ACTN|nr:beta-ketoacyl-ACP synthase 3 [Asanoa ferruginea]REF97416.1 3-oxoacyl-[acyl-carrier-protein] synthase-3 [Asanoa ferruginea]GIF48300.1 3-oxoacyl-[acyl-carrier-protein] synthase 3 protein 1 [Asanoa ferruginea]